LKARHDPGKATLISLSGLPGTGKSTIARKLAERLGAVWLRIDTIEQAVLASEIAHGPINDAGYRIAYAVAEDNLRLGLSVTADCVNDVLLARNAWRDVSLRARVALLEVEVICADVREHRRRVETRLADVTGLSYPDWRETIGRAYEPWDRERLLIDTAESSPDECATAILAAAETILGRSTDG